MRKRQPTPLGFKEVATKSLLSGYQSLFHLRVCWEGCLLALSGREQSNREGISLRAQRAALGLAWKSEQEVKSENRDNLGRLKIDTIPCHYGEMHHKTDILGKVACHLMKLHNRKHPEL